MVIQPGSVESLIESLLWWLYYGCLISDLGIDMSELNLPRYERDAIKEIDTEMLDKLIEQSLYDERPDALRDIGVGRCGLYVASRLRMYEQALAEYRNAKAAKKRSDMESRARRAGGDLAAAVQQMKHRVEMEEHDEQFFRIDDMIIPPHNFSERMTIRVNYHWRKTLDDEWVYGCIAFSHRAKLQPDYSMARPVRKPSAAKLEQKRQDQLFSEWEHLKRLALQSVQQYLKDGGDGAAIPETFQVVTDQHNGVLNNFSARFWLVPSPPQ